MSRALFIRHGQASFGTDNYDRLSDKGIRQSKLLGETWLKDDVMFDKMYVGPLQRQMQTYEQVRDIYKQNKVELPDPIVIDGLAEHKGPETMRAVLPQLSEKYENVSKWLNDTKENPENKKANHFRTFHFFMSKWATGDHDIDIPDHLERWEDFQENVSKAIQQILSENEKGSTVAAFTSGGTIATVMGYALEMDNQDRIIEMNNYVRNSSVSQFLFSNGRIALHNFNDISHINDKELITFV